MVRVTGGFHVEVNMVASGIAIVAFVIGLNLLRTDHRRSEHGRLHLKFNRMKVDPFLIAGMLLIYIVALLLVILNQEPLLCVTIACSA